jgi:YD repeat-containing protein
VNVHNAAGRLARRLVEEDLRAGSHAFAWDGADESGRLLPNGLYVVRVRAAFADAQMLVLIWSP